jgi:hypothetical protein
LWREPKSNTALPKLPCPGGELKATKLVNNLRWFWIQGVSL